MSVLAAAVVGFVIGRSSASSSQSAELDAVRTQLRLVGQSRDTLHKTLDDINRALRSVAQVDLDEYSRLQDAEERARRYGALLGQVFVVLMNYALVPDAPGRQAAIAALTSGGGTLADRDAATGAEPADTATKGGDPYIAMAADDAPATPTSPTSAWTKAEETISQVTLENAATFLAKAEIPDLRQEIRNGRPFHADDPRLAPLQGLFSGDVSYTDPKRSPLTIEIEMAATEVESGKLKGSYGVRLYKNGERTGNSNSKGTLDRIMNTSGQSSALVIEIAPDQFVQLYYLAGPDALVGNLYEMSSAKNSKLIGRVKLTR